MDKHLKSLANLGGRTIAGVIYMLCPNSVIKRNPLFCFRAHSAHLRLRNSRQWGSIAGVCLVCDAVFDNMRYVVSKGIVLNILIQRDTVNLA